MCDQEPTGEDYAIYSIMKFYNVELFKTNSGVSVMAQGSSIFEFIKSDADNSNFITHFTINVYIPNGHSKDEIRQLLAANDIKTCYDDSNQDWIRITMPREQLLLKTNDNVTVIATSSKPSELLSAYHEDVEMYLTQHINKKLMTVQIPDSSNKDEIRDLLKQVRYTQNKYFKIKTKF